METILIIDDNKKNLQVIGNVLREDKYKIAVATNGKDGIRLVEKIRPDLILLDIMMPEMDGFTACGIIKKKHENKEIPIIFLTAKTETEDIVKGFENGGVDYITKPFKKDELLVRIKTHIELKKSKDTIRKQAEDLRVLNDFKNTIFSIIAHDLKGAIGGFKEVTTFLSFDIETITKGEAKDFIFLLKERADIIYMLLENLLLWARTQKKEIKVSPQKIHLKQLTDDLINEYHTFSTKPLIISSSIPETINVKGDIEMIKIIMRNLISNAIKFTPENGEINIYSSEKNGDVSVFIQDNGIGIKQEDIDKLFNDKVHFTTYGTNQEKGSGLGLKICKELIEMNEGKISVNSDTGSGSVFNFSLKKA